MGTLSLFKRVQCHNSRKKWPIQGNWGSFFTENSFPPPTLSVNVEAEVDAGRSSHHIAELSGSIIGQENKKLQNTSSYGRYTHIQRKALRTVHFEIWHSNHNERFNQAVANGQEIQPCKLWALKQTIEFLCIWVSSPVLQG